ncbi:MULTISPECIES: hypothetical protein [Paenibacillus]|uniref:Uncharacterized protein n=1 Tax=Paenibacillus oceani TaxID=2772510 RepID=A0A927CIK8_9BACL|nr:hypothetical protein [Paenibacillus oceani]MBD2866380.1 hypothetical protein [Paenibacillus oceani]
MSTTIQAMMPHASQFPSTCPRYPNVWFYVNTTLCPSYGAARDLVMRELETCIDMANDFGYSHNAEGCDAFARRRGLQPIHLGEDGARSHDHCVHLRFYYEALKSCQLVELDGIQYYQYAASVHYEVDRPRPLHPYVDECPHCGCTGEYASYQGAVTSVKNERVHDPLGAEIVVNGTIRGEKIVAFNGVSSLQERYKMRIEQFRPEREDMNTAVVAAVFLEDRR